MREVHRVKVIDFLPANRFEKVLQGELNKLSEEGFKVETEIKMTNSRFFSAVLIGKREPFAKHVCVDTGIEIKDLTKVDYGKEVQVELDGKTIAKGTMEQQIRNRTGL